MSKQTDRIISMLTPYGLSENEARVYLVALENGQLSALQISRNIRMGRTKVYRVLDSLIAKGLVLQQLGEAGFVFVATDPEKLTEMVNRKTAEARELEKRLPKTQEMLSQIMGGGMPGSKVLYYRGVKGLKRVNFNVVRAKEEYLTYEVDFMPYLQKKDAEDLRRMLVEAKVMGKNLINHKKLEKFTKVTEMVRNYWEVRYIDPDIFKIKADMFIYNDVVAMCHYLDTGDVFCVEIYNQTLADMQRQLYEIVWAQAKKMKKVGKYGKAILA